jgi:hypothetical protein
MDRITLRPKTFIQDDKFISDEVLTIECLGGDPSYYHVWTWNKEQIRAAIQYNPGEPYVVMPRGEKAGRKGYRCMYVQQEQVQPSDTARSYHWHLVALACGSSKQAQIILDWVGKGE